MSGHGSRRSPRPPFWQLHDEAGPLEISVVDFLGVDELHRVNSGGKESEGRVPAQPSKFI